MSEDMGCFAAQFKSMAKPPIVKKERSEEEEAVDNGGKEDNQQKDGAEIIGDIMASTVTEQYLCSPEGGQDLSADIGCSAASLNTQSESGMADKKRSEEQETVVHAATEVKQVVVLDTELLEQKGNVVLQTLLRAPRYFNFKGSRWETCQSCGEENHGAAGCCPLEKKKQPCFYCGHYGHNGKYCKKVTGCFICKRRGHLAKDCPDVKTEMRQGQSCEFCLKCGGTGHDMFTCKDGYSSSDLEKIQCWVCKGFGHLLCIDYKDYRPQQVSCYNCGKLGHLGSDCLNLRWNIRSASSCKTGGTGPSCSEGNNGDRDLLCEDSKSAKVQDLLRQMERSDVLSSEVASKKISRSRWRKRKRRQRKTEGGRWENGTQWGTRQECQSSEEPKSNVLLKQTAS